jgi:hypothetical protein
MTWLIWPWLWLCVVNVDREGRLHGLSLYRIAWLVGGTRQGCRWGFSVDMFYYENGNADEMNIENCPRPCSDGA